MPTLTPERAAADYCAAIRQHAPMDETGVIAVVRWCFGSNRAGQTRPEIYLEEAGRGLHLGLVKTIRESGAEIRTLATRHYGHITASAVDELVGILDSSTRLCNDSGPPSG